MSIQFLAKNVTTHVGFEAWDEPWQGTNWEHILGKFAHVKLTITSTDGVLDEVEVRPAARASKIIVISPEEMADTPRWLQDMVKRTVELV